MGKKTLTVDGIISEQMRKIGSRLTPQQRASNARQAWKTRRAKIAAILAEQGAR